MSVLYQALKRRDQIERTGDTVPPGAVFMAAPSSSNQWWKFLLTLGVLLVIAGYAYSSFKPVPAAVTPPPPLAQAAEPQQELIDGAVPAKVNLDDIAALMPDDAKVPLPTPPVRVTSDSAPRAVQERARALQAQGATSAALKLSAQPGGDFSSQVNRWGLVAETDPERALPHLQALVRERADSATARAQLGLAYVRLSRLADGEAELMAASALEPSNAQIWYNLGALSDVMEHPTAAQNAYENALLNAGDQPPFDRASVQARLNYLRGR